MIANLILFIKSENKKQQVHLYFYHYYLLTKVPLIYVAINLTFVKYCGGILLLSAVG